MDKFEDKKPLESADLENFLETAFDRLSFEKQRLLNDLEFKAGESTEFKKGLLREMEHSLRSGGESGLLRYLEKLKRTLKQEKDAMEKKGRSSAEFKEAEAKFELVEKIFGVIKKETGDWADQAKKSGEEKEGAEGTVKKFLKMSNEERLAEAKKHGGLLIGNIIDQIKFAVGLVTGIKSLREPFLAKRRAKKAERMAAIRQELIDSGKFRPKAADADSTDGQAQPESESTEKPKAA